jgi:asparagine synthase (glutamine-hydrolysing)
MCGIAGIAAINAPPPTTQQIRGMCDTIAHRGPDDEGIEVRGNVGIGMRRLAIIDLSGGNQPIYNEDRSVRIVFNGEIYNFQELKRDLMAQGHRFYTQSDTEVIIHAYEAYGERFPECLNGMFAFALHDEKRQRLILARDHIGIKPLFYYHDDRNLIWGSEIKAILASGLIARRLNIDALAQFMAWEYIPGSDTLFASISKLKPGHLLELDLANCRTQLRPYWSIAPPNDATSRSDAEWIERVDHKIQACVKQQLISDVPLGAFLSGGVDSSLVVSAMHDAKTFSIGFDDPSYNELAWARRVARHLKVDHKDAVIQPDIFALFDQLMYYLDDPIGDFSIFPTYLVSKHARQDVTVSLSGDGGDELFGGYETYLAQLKAQQYGQIPGFLRSRLIEPTISLLRPRPQKKGLVNKALRFVEGMHFPQEARHARWRLFVPDALRSLLFTPEAMNAITTATVQHVADLYREAENFQPISQCLYVDVKSYLVDNCLVKMDRMSMAVSLEARVPLLDKELVELAFQIPDHLKVTNGQTKILLKRIAAGYVPRECVYRPKEGFSIPIKNWLATELRPLMLELLQPDRLRRQGIFQAPTVERLMQEHLQGRANHSHVLWSLIIFQAWYQRWLKG